MNEEHPQGQGIFLPLRILDRALTGTPPIHQLAIVTSAAGALGAVIGWFIPAEAIGGVPG